MKICYLADASVGHFQQWAKFFDERGHDVHTISFVDNVDIKGRLHYIKSKREYDGINGGNYFLILNFPKVRKLIKELQPDILHAHYVTSYGFIGALANYLPFVITIHGSDILLDLNRNPLFHITTRFALRKASLVNSVSPQITKKLIGLGVKREKILELQYGVDTGIFKLGENKTSTFKKLRIVSTRKHSSIYNLDLLIDAIAIVVKRIKNMEVYILSDGPEKERLKEKVKALGLSQYIRFIGQLPQSDVVKYLQGSDIYLSTSLSDGASISLLEAMACGPFPVVTDIPANREWINNGLNGFLVPTDNPLVLSEKIYEVFSNKHMIEEALRINVALIKEKASLEKNMGKVEEIYLKLAKNKHDNSYSKGILK